MYAKLALRNICLLYTSGFDLILVSSIGEAKRRIFEDKEIELILCDLELPDGTAMELFHTPVSYTHLGQTIEVNLGNGKQTYTVSGIMDVENDSRMFQLYVSEAFVCLLYTSRNRREEIY